MSRVWIVSLLLLVACGGGTRQTPAPAAATASKHVDQATVGTVSGRVVLEGTPPKPDVIKMTSDPVCREHGGTRETEFIVTGPDHSLKNVVVYVKAGLSGYRFDPPAQPVQLNQKDCRYEPHVIALQVGQPLEIVNGDPTLHNVHAIPNVNQEFNFGQPIQGLRTSHTFTAPEVGIPIACDVHGWMHAYAAVFDHPYYAVTGSNGGFSLKSLPPGTYQIEAWHEKLGTQVQSVTIGPKESKDVTFTFKAS